ncbi:hypothetical protein RclHR1_01160019 [Rhizophagus clarus]|uniref:ATP-dependent DNA helicase PIF1 n=1 Tax=Rhizophagus clarus TaxID=94130 RepID=A0A2Z6Q637_9GLOM|nr:hypothetical protein RclHR1_01160019 [Rhizophagus clarus]GET01392.1 ATP-dependent DNA helicase Pif1-like [Rhizophagus clarus]
MITKTQNDTNSNENSSLYTEADIARFKSVEKSLLSKKNTHRNTKTFNSAFNYMSVPQKNTRPYVQSILQNSSFSSARKNTTSIQQQSSVQSSAQLFAQSPAQSSAQSSTQSSAQLSTQPSQPLTQPSTQPSTKSFQIIENVEKKQESLKSQNRSIVQQKRKGTGYVFDEWSDEEDWQPESKKRYLKNVEKNRVLNEVSNKETGVSGNDELSEEQQRIFNLVVLDRDNIFFTGSAGTGKSFLLQRIITSLKARYGSETVAVTATTGIAAVNISGTTLHSFAGVGLGRGTAAELIKSVQKSVAARNRWKSIDTLIIDEISMLDADLFDKLENIARTVRNNNRPFGGIQLVVTGDFFQLPPVSKNSKFCFEALKWKTCLKHTIQLTKIYRQKDSELIELLNEMRYGEVSDKSLKLLDRLANEPNYPNDGIRPTELYPINDMVNKANATELGKIPHKSYIYTSNDWEPLRGGQLHNLIKNCLAPERLELKRDSQVMLIKNLSRDLVNGSRGVVVGFHDKEDGSSYYNGDDEGLERLNGKKLSPIVRFTNSLEMVMEEAEWTITSPGDVVLASRKQIPLVLAWAISIHKSQGQTLERVKVDLGRVFEKGQAYVALSRATSVRSLQVSGFRKDKVMCHEKVKRFYNSLTTIFSI